MKAKYKELSGSRRLAQVVLGSLFTMGFAAGTAQADFPEKQYNAVVGWSAGGGMDAYTRTVGKFAGKYLGKDFVIQYKKGGGGRTAFNWAAKGKQNDGYTIMATLVPNYILGTLTQKKSKRGYELADFEMLGTHACVPSGWLVKKGGKFTTLKDVVAFAKKNPGKVTVSVAGAKSGNNAYRLVAEKALGIKVKAIVYKGGSNALKALLGDEVMLMSSNANWLRRFPEKVGGLMLASPARYALAENVPTMKELGYDITDCLSRGLSVPKGVPADRVAFLRKGMAAMAKDPEFKKEMAKVGLVADFWDYQRTDSFINNYVKNNEFVFTAMSKKKTK